MSVVNYKVDGAAYSSQGKIQGFLNFICVFLESPPFRAASLSTSPLVPIYSLLRL